LEKIKISTVKKISKFWGAKAPPFTHNNPPLMINVLLFISC